MRKFSLCIAALLCALLMCSCGQDKVEVSTGQEDRVNGFMFVFDNRSATESLKNDMDARRIPVKARWKLDKRYETTDEQDIRAIYREMSEMIVVGQTNLSVQDHGYYVHISILSQSRSCEWAISGMYWRATAVSGECCGRLRIGKMHKISADCGGAENDDG